MSVQSLYSNGKLLLTGEYLVIDGAKALAVPTQKGQALTVNEMGKGSQLIWKSLTYDEKCWLEVNFSLPDFSIEKSSDQNKSNWLQKLLISVRELNPNFLTKSKSIEVKTTLDFPRDWGLGSSSTLINNVAQWAQIDPFSLHFKISNGSGYDIACAKEDSPIVYSTKHEIQTITPIQLEKSFFDQVFFVHLNKKQNSFDAVTSYNDVKTGIEIQDCIESLNQITNKFIQADSLKDWEQAMNEHEHLLSNVLEQETIKEKLFPMYPNSIKSLGAWGGDFAMVTGTSSDINYFILKGYDTIVPWKEMVLR
ncbi:MAG: GYDIA family GHMP kinase [Flavobacteriales bacterium]|nr:GYDIA family GHMP kinase [Flavobacteriales bacterium]